MERPRGLIHQMYSLSASGSRTGRGHLVSLLALILVATACGPSRATVSQTSQTVLSRAETTSSSTVPVSVPVSDAVALSATTTTAALVSTTSSLPLADSGGEEKDLEAWLAVAARLAPLVTPSDCGIPFDEPESMPNSPREYRAGVHQGIDFICGEPGRVAVASMGGRVVVANNSFVDPLPAERAGLLEEATELGFTPPWTLQMLYGRFVVLDHGIIDGVGHVVTLYAHFEQIDPAIRPGLFVEAGTLLGEIGNRGTYTAAINGTRAQSIHLHWEIHIDGEFLGAGLGSDETRQVYRELFES
ncbi:MAG TPA: M23 family metallopeptidase [Actinobacteria bacterium]|nr:M23 family metallopeptidase [Actinomycetota bacterium]